MSEKIISELPMEERIRLKYEGLGLNTKTFVEGLLWSKPISYWEYVNLDALLSLQQQRTVFPDEQVFIIYHQINELLFKMVLHEIEQLANAQGISAKFFKERLKRIDNYFGVLSNSFNIMGDGMEVEQYLRFRNTLAPASGFQSAQYRMIELCCTDFENLVDARYRADYDEEWNWDEKFDKLYWQAAGVDHETGQKNYMLEDFESKYRNQLIDLAIDYEESNLYRIYLSFSDEEQGDAELKEIMRRLDHTINVTWVMNHLNAARKYLNHGNEKRAATGGSPWEKYMHPRYQRRIFFPEVWTDEEQADWGKEVDD